MCTMGLSCCVCEPGTHQFIPEDKQLLGLGSRLSDPEIQQWGRVMAKTPKTRGEIPQGQGCSCYLSWTQGRGCWVRHHGWRLSFLESFLSFTHMHLIPMAASSSTVPFGLSPGCSAPPREPEIPSAPASLPRSVAEMQLRSSTKPCGRVLTGGPRRRRNMARDKPA